MRPSGFSIIPVGMEIFRVVQLLCNFRALRTDSRVLPSCKGMASGFYSQPCDPGIIEHIRMRTRVIFLFTRIQSRTVLQLLATNSNIFPVISSWQLVTFQHGSVVIMHHLLYLVRRRDRSVGFLSEISCSSHL